jgi:hypothetical protein
MTPEQIHQNWEKFRALCKTLKGDRSEKIEKMLDVIEENMAIAPASCKLDHHSCWAGGLADHSLRVLNNAHTISKSVGLKIDKESMILCALFHDLGKVGHVTDDDQVIDHYVEQTSEWHREKLGEMYVYNKKIPYMTVAQRSLWLLQRFGVRLSHEEYVAILVHDGFILEENRKYIFKEPTLATVLSMADYLATQQEKEMLKDVEAISEKVE